MKFRILLCAAMCAQLLLVNSANAAYVGGNYISSKGACVMDYDTGEILYEYDGNTPRVPASMTKIMNLYCVYESLANGEISLDTIVPISENVYNKSRNSVYQSVLPLYYNTTYTVDEMLGVVVTYSASGAAVALAELVGGGSESVFVERMNNKAVQMGIDARYYDSCGIADNKVSPIAMATLARNIIRDYPDILSRSSKKSVYFHGNTYNTTNHLLDSYYYAGADGLKTGTTPASGYCFCGTAVRNGRRMISVIMNSDSTGQRFVDTARLLDFGFSAASDKFDSIYYTDMRTFINGEEMPTFAYKGTSEHAVIVAEDLRDYGFDVIYDEAENILRVSYIESPAMPIPLDSYKGRNGEKARSISRSSQTRVIIEDYEPAYIYNIGGMMCVSVDELAKIYDFYWDDEEKAAFITAERRPDSAPELSEANTAQLYESAEDITINIDGNYVMNFTDQQPVIIDGHTMTPIRELMETLEKSVEWDAQSSAAIIKDDHTAVKITEGSDTLIKEITNPIDGSIREVRQKLEAAPVIINNRMCLPLREVVEAFDCAVIWEQDTKTILIIAGVC